MKRGTAVVLVGCSLLVAIGAMRLVRAVEEGKYIYVPATRDLRLVGRWNGVVRSPAPGERGIAESILFRADGTATIREAPTVDAPDIEWTSDLPFDWGTEGGELILRIVDDHTHTQVRARYNVAPNGRSVRLAAGYSHFSDNRLPKTLRSVASR